MSMSVEELHDWLNALGLLPEHDEKAFLADLLKDGISLCRLANRLKPGVVSNISTGYLPENARENVANFILACPAMDIQESFDVQDLLEMRDFDRVLNTLQALFQYSSKIGLIKDFARPQTGNASEPSLGQAEFGQHIARALYNFSGMGDDELSFQKGDRIVVIKVVDGGWWEGMLGEKVGWFPGNHVEEITPEEPSSLGTKELVLGKRDSLLKYYELVVKDIVETERAYVLDLMLLLSAYLTPMETADVITTEEVAHLTGNLPVLAADQEKFFKKLERIVKLPCNQQSIASLFMEVSNEMEKLYIAYCMNHPRAVAILTDNSDKLSAYMESKGAAIPGMLVLTQNLSKPMRRLEKYPALLVELQRQTQDDHQDKQKVEEAIAFYSDLLAQSQEVRKKKEAEYEMLSNPVKNYAGKCLLELGECACVVTGSEVISAELIDERFYLVFPGVMVILAVGQSLSGYELQYKFQLSTVTVKKAVDEESFVNAVEIVYNNNKAIQTSISSAKDMNILLNTVAANGKVVATDIGNTPERSVSPVANNQTKPRYSTHHRRLSTPVQRPCFWGFKSLRPAPPLNSVQIMQLREEKEKGSKSHKSFINVTSFKRRSKADDVHVPITASIERVAPESVQANQGDAVVLRVIEAYCQGTKMRQAAMLLEPPATAPIPIRQVPSAPSVLHSHNSSSQLEVKRPSSPPKKSRRFSFMPGGGKKDNSSSQAFTRSPLRHSLRETSTHKKNQGGSVPDFMALSVNKNKNSNCNRDNDTTASNLTMASALFDGVITHIPASSSGSLNIAAAANGNNNNSNYATVTDFLGDDDMCTTSEITLSVHDTDASQETEQFRERSASETGQLVGNNVVLEKPALRDSDEELHRHPSLLARGLCLGSYPLFGKGK